MTWQTRYSLTPKVLSENQWQLYWLSMENEFAHFQQVMQLYLREKKKKKKRGTCIGTVLVWPRSIRIYPHMLHQSQFQLLATELCKWGLVWITHGKSSHLESSNYVILIHLTPCIIHHLWPAFNNTSNRWKHKRNMKASSYQKSQSCTQDAYINVLCRDGLGTSL